MCENLHHESVYLQRATQRARILLTDNIQSGAAVVSTITSYTCNDDNFVKGLPAVFSFSVIILVTSRFE